ncbi:Thymidine kinase [Capnocytophaga canimorsus]|uniref:Thymidine kinase n=2 Tax=Capnocytophaga canimorsus TaxID=28188 RepID=A0A0B7ILN6_9FLAO|nr:Thymidine kinase [Capnocytophaga canimorsus]
MNCTKNHKPLIYKNINSLLVKNPSEIQKNTYFCERYNSIMFLENTTNYSEKFGWIEVICGSMFSGKTEELIRRLRRAQFAKQKVEIFKPAFDTRYDDVMVVSHNANEIRSTPVPAAANIMLLADGCDVIGIDEAQFFDDEIVTVCNDLANRGMRVIVAGLDMDFKGKPFGPMPALMATAEYVTKVHAVCTRTGNLANFSYRKSANENIFLLGEQEAYEPLSRAAYFKAMKEKK